MTVVQDADGARRRVAQYLAEHGPVWGEAAAAALGFTLVRWWLIVDKCRWFTFDGPGPAGWRLTEEGAQEVCKQVTQTEGDSC